MRVRNILAALMLYSGSLGFAATGGSFLQLPYNASDSSGNQWTIYQNGMLQQRGNQPVYSQGALLLVNGEPIQPGANRARLDPDTGEVVFENLSAGGMNITRHVLVKADEGYVRYVDVLKNPTAQEQTLDVQLQSRVNFQLNANQTVPDPHVKDRVLAWLGQTQVNRTAVEMLAGRSARSAFNVQWQQENNLMQADMSVKVPAGKSIAFMHVHSTSATIDTAAEWVRNLKEANLLKTVPPALRKILVNFSSGPTFVGDAEVLRGDLLDVVELRGGDQLKGTLKEPGYPLQTFYGEINVASDRVIGLLNSGIYHPRQLLVTNDGQVFGGQLDKQTIAMELSSGQVTQVPLTQITRLGYRQRAGDTSDSGDQKTDHPMIFLRTGDRMAVTAPQEPIDFMTRYGLLKLDAKSISAFAFQSDDNAVHTAYLTDGSRIAGLVSGDQFKMTLSPAADAGSATRPAVPSQTVTIPAATLFRWQLTDKTADAGDEAPALKLTNGDLFVGSLTGQLKLDTLFDTITVNADEIRSLVHEHDAGADVQIELWDQTRLSGSLRESDLTCTLICGQVIQSPVALIDSYLQPHPQPSATMVQQIKSVVADLSADEWKKRDEAQNHLIAMGSPIAGVLKQLSPGVPPEAQQRIEVVLKQIGDKKKNAAGAE